MAIYLWKKYKYIMYDANKNDQASIRRAYGVTTGQFIESLCANI